MMLHLKFRKKSVQEELKDASFINKTIERFKT